MPPSSVMPFGDQKAPYTQFTSLCIKGCLRKSVEDVRKHITSETVEAYVKDKLQECEEFLHDWTSEVRGKVTTCGEKMVKLMEEFNAGRLSHGPDVPMWEEGEEEEVKGLMADCMLGLKNLVGHLQEELTKFKAGQLDDDDGEMKGRGEEEVKGGGDEDDGPVATVAWDQFDVAGMGSLVEQMRNLQMKLTTMFEGGEGLDAMGESGKGRDHKVRDTEACGKHGMANKMRQLVKRMQCLVKQWQRWVEDSMDWMRAVQVEVKEAVEDVKELASRFEQKFKWVFEGGTRAAGTWCVHRVCVHVCVL